METVRERGGKERERQTDRKRKRETERREQERTEIRNKISNTKGMERGMKLHFT